LDAGLKPSSNPKCKGNSKGNSRFLRSTKRRFALVSFAERDFEGVDVLSVADAFELAIELGGGIVGVAIFVLVFGFGLTLLESVVEIRLGDGLERDESEAEGCCGGIKAPVVRIGGFFSAVSEALEKEYGDEERERG
jgi:hypothetical protein